MTFLLCGRLLKSLTWELIFPQGRVCLPVTLASSAWRITQKNEALEFLAFSKFILIDVYSRNEHCWKGQWCNAKLKGNFHETHTYETASAGRDGYCCFSFSFWRLLSLTGLGWVRSLFCVLVTWEVFTSEFSYSLWAVLQAYVLLRTMSWSLSRLSVLKWQGVMGLRSACWQDELTQFISSILSGYNVEFTSHRNLEENAVINVKPAWFRFTMAFTTPASSFFTFPGFLIVCLANYPSVILSFIHPYHSK